MARIWPDIARKAIRVSTPQWALTGEGEDRTRLGASLLPYWGQRLGALGGNWISAQGVSRLELLAKQGVYAAGFERLDEALDGKSEAFWFLELGWLAWMRALVDLRTGEHPLWQGRPEALRVERAWMQGVDGARKIIQEISEGEPTTDILMMLYSIPLTIWADGEYAQALRLIDHLVRLDESTRRELGSLVVLSAALCHGMLGRPEVAARLLAIGPYNQHDEVQYHRARYLWDVPGSQEDAMALLEQVIKSKSAYLPRMLGDIIWQGRDETGVRVLGALASTIQSDASRALTRWQQRESGPAEDWLGEVLLREIGPEPLITVLAGLSLPTAKAGQRLEELSGVLEKIRGYIGALPAAIPFQLEGSLSLEALETAVAQGRVDEAAWRAEGMDRDLPLAVKIALISYGGELAAQLAQAGDLLQRHGVGEGSKERLKQCSALLTRTAALVEPLRELGTAMDTDAVRRMGSIATRFGGIATAWGRATEEAVGRLRLSVRGGGEGIRVKADDFFPVQIVVQDVSGQSVVGVPVVWRIKSGPGAMRQSDGESYLSESMAVSSAAGTVFLPIAGQGIEGNGEIEAYVLGQKAIFKLRYSVVK